MCCEPDGEEIALVSCASRGDQASMRTLLERFHPLLLSLAKRIRCVSSVPLEELIQAGSLGLMRAVERYDSAYGTRLSTYAVPWILGEMRRALRETLTGCVSLDETDEQRNSAWMDRLCSSGGVDVEHMALRLAIEQLDQSEQTLVCLRYFRGYTQKETARLMRKSQAQISRMERRALDRLKALLTG